MRKIFQVPTLKFEVCITFRSFKFQHEIYKQIFELKKSFQNDALFWYNLLRSGVGDLRTRHAACPVLTGTKWVSNKWIHERGQEFRRPCGLERSVEEQFVGDLGA